MPKVGILICSCDYYSDCWEPMIYSLEKFWPDCEYPKFIVANHKTANLPKTTVLNVGDHKGWASDTKKAVRMTDCDFFIYFQEDYFLEKKVNNDAIKKHIQHCEETGVEYLKIQKDIFNNDKDRIGNSDYCLNPINQKYRINTATAIWKRDLFDKVLRDGDTGWDFEYTITPWILKNNIQFKSEMLLSNLYDTKGITMIRGNAIQRGKWTPAGVKFLMDNGFEVLVGTRKIQNSLYSQIYSLEVKGFLRVIKLVILRIMRKVGLN